MAETRPSGNPIVPDLDAPVVQEIATISERGQIHILSRWARRVDWLPVPATGALDALMVFVEPGFLSLRSWEPDGPRIATRYEQLAKHEDDPDLVALRLIQDRYGKLSIPKERRPYLGDAALQHLGLPTTRNVKSNVYVVISAGGIDLLSSVYRNAKNIGGHPALDDLP